MLHIALYMLPEVQVLLVRAHQCHVTAGQCHPDLPEEILRVVAVEKGHHLLLHSPIPAHPVLRSYFSKNRSECEVVLYNQTTW